MPITSALRRQFPHTAKKIYFNVASNGPMPTTAHNVLLESLRTARDAEINKQENVFQALDSISSSGAKIFGCKKDEVGFGFNTTYGVNLAAFGLPLKKGDEVLLSDVDFPANIYPWLELRNRGIRVTLLKSKNGFFDIEALQKAISKKTRALSVSFVQFHNGYKNDLKTIGDICKKHKMYFVVDAIQGAGVEPMQVKKWGVDIASAGAQKWLLSSQGTGIFYISEEMQRHIIPPWRSWLSIDWKCDWTNLNDYTRAYPESARQFELGTYPVPLMLAMDESLKFITGLGVKAIQKHNHGLHDLLIDYLKTSPVYRITSDTQAKHRSGILTFAPNQGDVATLYAGLVRRKIIAAMREGSIRISVHVFNNTAEIKKLIQGLDFIAAHH